VEADEEEKEINMDRDREGKNRGTASRAGSTNGGKIGA
jgi:hypothetical protein